MASHLRNNLFRAAFQRTIRFFWHEELTERIGVTTVTPVERSFSYKNKDKPWSLPLSHQRTDSLLR